MYFNTGVIVYAKENDTWVEFTNKFENDEIFSEIVGSLSLSKDNNSLEVAFASGKLYYDNIMNPLGTVHLI